nr:MerR family transcriptional regulator [Nguyenibacter vanlangensis]
MSSASPGQEFWQDDASAHAVEAAGGYGQAGDGRMEEEQAGDDPAGRLKKAPHAFRTISEVADELHVPQHVLRFWETRFSQVRPLKRGGGRRYYRPDDIELLRRISDLLYVQGYTIKGVQRMLREGADVVVPAGSADGSDDEDLFGQPEESPAHGAAAAAGQDGVAGPESTDPESAGFEPTDPGLVCAEPVILGAESAPDVAEQAPFVTPPAAASISDTVPPSGPSQGVEISGVESSETRPAADAESERIRQENLLLKDSLRGILVELRALRRLIPV